jgi:hypothetical protein
MITMIMLQTSAELRAAGGLDAFSMLFMLASMGAVTALMVWSFSRILSGKKHFDPDGTGPAHSPVPGEVDEDQV